MDNESRRTSRKQDSESSPKKKALIGGGVAAVLAVAGIATGVALHNPVTSLEETPEASEKIYFTGIDSIEGWSEPNQILGQEVSALTQAQTLGQIIREDDKCTYTSQIFHLPSYQAGRGDEFLTKQYVYQLGESNNIAPLETSILTAPTDEGDIELLGASYESIRTIIDPETEEVTEETSSYRSVAVRAIDKLIPIEGAPEGTGLFDSDTSVGVPMISLTYECETQEDFSQEEFANLVQSTHLNVFSSEDPVAPEAPETATPSAPAEEGVPVEEETTGPAPEATISEEQPFEEDAPAEEEPTEEFPAAPEDSTETEETPAEEGQ